MNCGSCKATLPPGFEFKFYGDIITTQMRVPINLYPLHWQYKHAFVSKSFDFIFG